MQVKKQQLDLNMKQWTGSKLGKEYVKAVYCHHAYLTSMLIDQLVKNLPAMQETLGWFLGQEDSLEKG